jgi:hypothetical protein
VLTLDTIRKSCVLKQRSVTGSEIRIELLGNRLVPDSGTKVAYLMIVRVLDIDLFLSRCSKPELHRGCNFRGFAMLDP